MSQRASDGNNRQWGRERAKLETKDAGEACVCVLLYLHSYSNVHKFEFWTSKVRTFCVSPIQFFHSSVRRFRLSFRITNRIRLRLGTSSWWLVWEHWAKECFMSMNVLTKIVKMLGLFVCSCTNTCVYLHVFMYLYNCCVKPQAT